MNKNYTNAEADRWYEELVKHPENIPFSFTYGGKVYQGFSKAELSFKKKAIEENEQIYSERFLCADAMASP